ncbi:hypothetical protein LO771_16445 [Streptacidiphilus sp. ASG 303]|uniref:hypothetical protein n=1 Tax=Streptacidiphilus sp. ASG 303 TaxID=2896847 RepID=UPI001E4B5833|nr:hypothetical protein [Streptacidiphilus sp. ASG 303]MCD0483940.1 hypothetical protein [Streptacidiphilus sp. ASG 303]
MLIADGGGGMPGLAAAVGRQAFTAEVENLKTFKSKVDQMLQDLEGSAASQKQISDQRLASGHLGTGFGEAEDLFSAYAKVHDNLETLSKTLSQQIEAMSITVDVSTKGYQNVEESRLAELWKIRDQAEAAQKPPAAGGAPAPAASQGTKQGAF